MIPRITTTVTDVFTHAPKVTLGITTGLISIGTVMNELFGSVQFEPAPKVYARLVGLPQPVNPPPAPVSTGAFGLNVP
jgi:hypothetical protein